MLARVLHGPLLGDLWRRLALHDAADTTLDRLAWRLVATSSLYGARIALWVVKTPLAMAGEGSVAGSGRQATFCSSRGRAKAGIAVDDRPSSRATLLRELRHLEEGGHLAPGVVDQGGHGVWRQERWAAISGRRDCRSAVPGRAAHGSAAGARSTSWAEQPDAAHEG